MLSCSLLSWRLSGRGKAVPSGRGKTVLSGRGKGVLSGRGKAVVSGRVKADPQVVARLYPRLAAEDVRQLEETVATWRRHRCRVPRRPSHRYWSQPDANRPQIHITDTGGGQCAHQPVIISHMDAGSGAAGRPDGSGSGARVAAADSRAHGRPILGGRPAGSAHKAATPDTRNVQTAPTARADGRCLPGAPHCGRVPLWRGRGPCDRAETVTSCLLPGSSALHRLAERESTMRTLFAERELGQTCAFDGRPAVSAQQRTGKPSEGQSAPRSESVLSRAHTDRSPLRRQSASRGRLQH